MVKKKSGNSAIKKAAKKISMARKKKRASSSLTRDEVSKNGSRLPKALKKAQVYVECKTSEFDFRTTKDVQGSKDFISQDRAVRAIQVGLGIQKPGYNIYVSGHHGTGKESVIKTFLENWSAKQQSPNDWVYLYDFERPENPRVLELPRGEAKKFKKRLANFVRDLKVEIPKVLESEDYENAISTYLSASNDRKAKLYTELERYAQGLDFSIKSTRMGIETVPVLNGRALSEKDYGKLSESQRADVEKKRSKLEPEVLDFARKVRGIDQETRDYIESLRHDFGHALVREHLGPIIDYYQETGLTEVVDHLEKIKEDVVENLLSFVEQEEEYEEEAEERVMNRRDSKDFLRKYQVNVFVDNSKTKGAPVIIESNPTFYNLFGKVEKQVEYGIYNTDFTMIKAGSIHLANGGYLVLNAQDIFRTHGVWETLKRMLRSRKAFIEDMGEQFNMLPTSGLRPDPVPLELKVILIGNNDIYQILFDEDEEFKKIFKIKADFDYKMPRTAENINQYGSFIASRVEAEKLMPFDRSGIAAVVEHSSRMVEDQNYLSTQFGAIKDLTIESDYVARESGSKVVKREHVEAAVREQIYRHNLYEDQLLQMLETEEILLSFEGAVVGQINGLTVYDLGDCSFGKPVRITCTTAMSEDGISNIERISRLSGRIHDKGMSIITSLIHSLLAREYDLRLSASICFEQSYGPIDGDSASVAEAVAILSSMSGIPIRQNYAVTGSLNQFGEVQVIGGVNEKIEGFYKSCEMVGKADKYHVLIPDKNAQHLCLEPHLREAVGEGKLDIIPVTYLWQAFELLTGHKLGISHHTDKTFAPHSCLDIIAKKLQKIRDDEGKEDEAAEVKRIRKVVAKNKIDAEN